MATRIRLRRTGKKKQAYYRFVVADSRSPRDGRFIEILGNYNPHADPPEITIDEERTLYWIKTGAQPSNTVKSLLSKKGILARLAEERPDHPILKRPVRRGARVEKATVEPEAEEVAEVEEVVSEPETAAVEETVAEPEAVEREDAPAEVAAEADETPAEPEAAVEAEEAPAESEVPAEAEEDGDVAEETEEQSKE
ncbi:30S ribosomal protein S16 [Candidatus Zixiibacteriota bacterium]